MFVSADAVMKINKKMLQLGEPSRSFKLAKKFAGNSSFMHRPIIETFLSSALSEPALDRIDVTCLNCCSSTLEFVVRICLPILLMFLTSCSTSYKSILSASGRNAKSHVLLANESENMAAFYDSPMPYRI